LASIVSGNPGDFSARLELRCHLQNRERMSHRIQKLLKSNLIKGLRPDWMGFDGQFVFACEGRVKRTPTSAMAIDRPAVVTRRARHRVASRARNFR
jgi:hypothetical protein